MQQLAKVLTGVKANHGVVDALLGEMPEESLLKVEVTVAVPRTDGQPELMVALSAKVVTTNGSGTGLYVAG
jgi:hypothetical protein